MTRNEDVVKKYVIRLYQGGVVSSSIPALTLKTSAISVKEAIQRVQKEHPGAIITQCQEE
jgi:hypothetical protein